MNKQVNDERHGAISVYADDLSDGNVVSLLEEHRNEMFKLSPPEDVHALDIRALTSADIRFWSASIESENAQNHAGCAALKVLSDSSIELKSMKTKLEFLRQGVARALLSHLVDVAKQDGYSDLYLETGTAPEFNPAVALYREFGFDSTAPFANYTESEHSQCMRLKL